MTTPIPFLHRFQRDVSSIAIPQEFTFPFCYSPHPLSEIAAEELQDYLREQKDFQHNFGVDEHQSGAMIGKMFGVLVVLDSEDNLGYLTAVSGKLGNSNTHKHFVPPIYDMLDPTGFFCQEEQNINLLNQKIEKISASEERKLAETKLQEVLKKNTEELSDMRTQHKKNKAERKQIRQHITDTTSREARGILEDLIKQSYRDQHELAVRKQDCKFTYENAERHLRQINDEILSLKMERKQRSANLQQRLFDQYHFYNAFHELRDLRTIFRETATVTPPAGSGECAAPKLLQYAYQHRLKPVCLAEFWWGASPASEVRRHQQYYPACRSKCEPILNYMLQGLRLEPNPMLTAPILRSILEIIHEDDDIIVVNKPAEYLSVPGIHIKDSVYNTILAMRPEISGPVIIHRLDMSTSGIIVLAKHKVAHQYIQEQFIKRTVKKRYSALLDGLIPSEYGIIELPLRVDLDNRPRQMVCYEHGKPATTTYAKIGEYEGKTRVHFFPQTGRTHQLRIHAAHQSGLNTPIVGDDLYGQRANRLHLHAGFIQFLHPKTKAIISLEVPDPF